MRLFKTKVKAGIIKKYFCGICYCKKEIPFYYIPIEFAKDYKDKNFDVTYLDNKIKKQSDKIYNKKFNKFNGFKHKYGFFASELYETGGHKY